MKLIIDIPEDLYNKLVKYKEFYTSTTIFSAITNGTPYEERPQGEKIKKKPYGWVYCSECDSLLEPQDKFCWNCGAEMKGGAE